MFELMWQEKANCSIKRMARLLKVSRSDYYKWAQGQQRRLLGQDPRQNYLDGLDKQIKRIWDESDEAYGSPRITAGNPTMVRTALVDRWNWCGKYRTGGPIVNSADGVCRDRDICLSNARNQRHLEVACDDQSIAGMKRVRGNYQGADRAYIEAAILTISAARACRPGC